MPRQKQSKPKALKQQREEVEQLIRDGGTSDTKKQDGNSSAKSSGLPDVSCVVEKDRRGKGKKSHRHKNSAKVKIAKKVRKKRITKSPQVKELPDSNNLEVKDSIPNQNVNNNEKPLTETKELHSPTLVVEAGSEAASDSYVSDADILKDKYDMIKERSLKRATKVKHNIQEKERVKETESSPQIGSESPKKTPVSPVKEREIPRSSAKVNPSPVPLSPKPKVHNTPRKLSERESGRLHGRNLISQAQNLVKGRQRSVSEGMLTSQESLSKQQALEALLQITGVEFHTMSKVPSADQTPSVAERVTTGTTSTHIAPKTSHSGLQKGSMVKISETDKGVVKYHLQSDSLEEQGLKLVYTAHAVGQTNQDPVKYSAYRPRKNSTRSNASDSTEDPTAKDSPKCCKKPGRHVCQFCGRRCTKPSVLKKHIRSHTGERPYPCLPCGFSFKTKSNLYKHCKTHAHAIKAGLAPNSEDLSKLALADLEEDDSEETESEDEIITCDATTCQTELTEKFPHNDSQMHVGSIPQSEVHVESLRKTSLENKTTTPSNIPMMQVPRSLAAVPNIPRQQADSQSNQEAISRHSSSCVTTLNSVLPTSNIQKDMPLLSTLLPNQSSRSSDMLSGGRPSSAPSTSLVEFPKSNPGQQSERRNDEELVLSASGASSSQLLKSILPGELAGFRIDMETRRAIPVLNTQVGTPGSPSSTPSGEEAPSNTGQLLFPLTGFNIIKSGGQYHVQIPVQGIPEDSLTMSLEGETCSAGNSSNQTKGVSKESLQERIQLLISQNRAIVDDAVLESVKPRRTSASRRDSENNSPKIEFSSEPTRDGKSTELKNTQSSGHSEIQNPPLRYRTVSLSECQPSPSVSHAHLKYPLPGESNLLERALKSQQQSSLIGTSGADKHILVPMSDHQAMKIDILSHQTGNLTDNSNSIKDLLMQDRPHRLAQIAQQSPAHLSGDPSAGPGSPGTIFIPGSSWSFPQGSESAMNQLRGTLQHQRVGPQIQSQMYPSLYNAAEDVNISQRISELRGAARRRKYKSESDVLGDAMPSGPSSPKRRARKIKDMPSVVSPLATSSVRTQSANFMSPRTPTAIQKDLDLKPVASPHSNFASYPGIVPSQSNPLSSPTHLAAYPSPLTSKFGYSALHGGHHKATTTCHVPSMQSNMTSMQSHMTSISNAVTSVSSHVTTMQGDAFQYPSSMSSIQEGMSSQPRQRMSHPDIQQPHPVQGAPPVTLHHSMGTIPASHTCSVYTQALPSVSEVSVIQHTRMQGKSEPANKELKLEVGQAREVLPVGYPRPYRMAVPAQSPGAGSPASQGLHLLAVASKSPDLPSDIKGGSRKRCFSMSEGMQTVKNQELPLASQWPKEDPPEKQKLTDETSNAAPITIQLLAAVANSSSYVPRVSPRVNESCRVSIESANASQYLSDLPRKSNPSVSLSKEETLMQSPRSTPEVKQHREMGSPELKKIKMERNSVSPKSPRSENSRQIPSSLPRVPASRRHLTLDLKSPLTSRMKSPGASDTLKPLLQIDPKSLLTPEALSIAESVMKLASPMKANTPITPVESARELGRLMAHAFHNAGGKVESLITSTQGTMMIGPIATPTPGSASGSRQYFIIPSPSSSQPPTGFPGPSSLFSPSSSTTSSLISPLRSPLASSQPEADQVLITTDHAPHYRRVPPQKPDCQGPFERHILNHVKTNSALRQKIRSSKLSHSTARNRNITKPTFCCVKRPQPMYVQQGGNRKISMYSNWRPGGNCPHPLGISWKAHLALYDTGRNKKPKFYYVTTSISPPQGGIVTDSAGWRPEIATQEADNQSHSEAPHVEMMDKSSVKSTDAGCTLDKSILENDTFKAKEKRPKEASDHSEPSRIPIFSGGYKSNENYVYVRGRGRGKYVCEECGIRCKKPSMLKKHIRTHTDMRPYQCQICVFAFKTKGNLTKHMKSKAHSKKCTKNGISAADESCMEHQFSDADDEDTDSADGDTSDEDEDDDEDDDISETHSESAVPVSGVVSHRERYSSVPNIQDMPESIDAQGRPLVWHQYHQGRMKKDQDETHGRPRLDSTESISALDSSKSGAHSNEISDEKQPVKLSRSEVVGKLSRHLTNRHQQSLEKAQKAGVSAVGKSGEIKDHDSCKMFDISLLPPIHPGLLPQPTKLAHLSHFSGSKVDGLPPEPPVLDKYGHIVLTMSNSSTSQYRLSTTVQDNLISLSKLRPSNGNFESHISQPASVQPLPSLEKQLTRQSHLSTDFLAAGPLFLQDKLRTTSYGSSVTTSGTLSSKEHMPNLVQTQSSTSTMSVLHTDTNVTCSSSFPSHHELTLIPANIPPGPTNLVAGLNPIHAISNRDVHMVPHHPVWSEAQTPIGAQQVAFQSNFGVSPHLQRLMSPPFLSSFQDPSRAVASSSLSSSSTKSPSPQSRPLLSPRVHPSAAVPYQLPSEAAQSISTPICVEAISDDEDEQGSRKRQKVDPQEHHIMVSGSINKPSGSFPSSVPSWMSEPGSAIKQLLLARPSLVPPSHESAKSSFFSPFLPPSLVSPKLVKSSLVVSMSSSLQQPLVSPMVPSKMMQLPPTILSQVRSPTLQSSSFPPREDHRDSPGPFVPPVARAKSQFQWASPQPQCSEKPPLGDPIPLEVTEELVTSPTHAGNHKCPSCNKVFMKPSQLRIHMRIHLEEHSFSCPECMLSFQTRILLAKHERSEEHLSKVDAVELPSASSESDPRPFKCKECQIAFRIPGHLAKHLRSRGHRMTLEREGKLPLPKEELMWSDMSDTEQGDLIIDDTQQPPSPGGSSDKTDSASEAGDVDHLDSISTA